MYQGEKKPKYVLAKMRRRVLGDLDTLALMDTQKD